MISKEKDKFWYWLTFEKASSSIEMYSTTSWHFASDYFGPGVKYSYQQVVGLKGDESWAIRQLWNRWWYDYLILSCLILFFKVNHTVICKREWKREREKEQTIIRAISTNTHSNNTLIFFYYFFLFLLYILNTTL